MCQNWLAILKNSCPLSTRSIVFSSASDVHFPRCVKLATLFILASFSTCTRNIGGLLVMQVTSSLAKYNGHHGVNPLLRGPNF